MAAAALLSITLAPLDGVLHPRQNPSRGEEPDQPAPHLGLPSGDRLCHSVALAGDYRSWRDRRVGVLPWNLLVTERLPEGKLKDLAGTLGKAFRFRTSARSYSSALRRRPPLYADDISRHLGHKSTRANSSHRPNHQDFPEVHHVFGKIGRAETATDPAPFDMVETTVMLKSEDQWPEVNIKDDTGKVVAHRRRTPNRAGHSNQRSDSNSWPEQRLDDADQNAHRHARDRYQDAGGN